MDGIYTTPTPTPSEDATWLEKAVSEVRRTQKVLTEIHAGGFFLYTESFKRCIHFQTQREEAKKFAEIKRKLRQEIHELRQTVLQMMYDNQQTPEIERLDRHEYNLDVDQRQKLVLEGEEKIKQV